MPAYRPSICKRHGCTASRERWQLVCATCWLEVPYAERQRFLRARKAKLTRIAGELGRAILRKLGRRPAEASPPATAPAPTIAYARNCALLGERDEIDGKN